MATITASPTGGNWSATTAWVGGVVPGSGDNVILTATSGNITVDGTSGSPSNCNNFTFTAYTGTLTMGVTSVLNIYGSMSLASGATFAPNNQANINFMATTTGQTVMHAGYSLCNLTYNGVGGGWTWQDGLAAPATPSITITLTNGSLNTNNFNTNSSGFSWQFSSNNSNTRSLTLGTSTLLIGSWDIGVSTGMTLSASSSTLTQAITATTSFFNGGGLSYNNVTLTQGSGGATTISGANTFSNLTLQGAGSGLGSYTTATGASISGNQNITGTLTITGNSVSIRNFIYATTEGSPITITASTVSINNSDFRDIIGAGSANWNLSSITGGAGDCGGNSGITFNTPKNCYMKTAVSVNWSASNWFTTSGGSTAIVPSVPLPQDTAIFDASSVSAASKTITIDAVMVRFPSIDFTGVTNTPTFASGTGTSYEFYGRVILISGMTHTGTGTWTFKGRGSNTLDGGGLTWPTTSAIIVNSISGTLSLASNFTSNSTVTVTRGTLTGSFTLSCTTLTVQTTGTFTLGGNVTLSGNTTCSTGGTISGSFSISGGTTGTFSGGTVNISGWSGTVPTVSAGSVTVGTLVSTTSTFSGGTANITTHTASGTTTVSGGAYNIVNLNGTALTVSAGTATATGTTTLTGALQVSSSGVLNATGQTITGGTTLSHSSSGACTIGTLVLSSTLANTSTATLTIGTCTATTYAFTGANTRTIVGTGTWTATGTGTVWNESGNNVTPSFSVATIDITDTSATTKTFAGNGKTYGNLTISGAASNGTVTITGSNTFGVLTLNPNASLLLTSSTTTSATTFAATGTSGNTITIAATTPGTFASLSLSNPASCDYLSIQDNHVSPLSIAGKNSTLVSNFNGWSTGAGTYWVGGYI